MAKFKFYSFESTRKSSGFEEDAVERGDQSNEEICGRRKGQTSKRMFMLPIDARRSKKPRIKFQVNRHFVFRR